MDVAGNGPAITRDFKMVKYPQTLSETHLNEWEQRRFPEMSILDVLSHIKRHEVSAHAAAILTMVAPRVKKLEARN